MHSSHSTMIRTIRHPESKQATTLTVAVRCRPLTDIERSKSRGILRVVDDKVVVVLDPDAPRDYLDRAHNRSKEKSYAFDFAFGAKSTNKDVYNTAISSYIDGVAQGLNATVFAYGATGSGKTHTMAGTTKDPGLMVLSLQEIFRLVAREEREYEFEVTCSYLEVYNEIIYDLLERSSGHLELREDPDQGITVAGLKRIQVNSAEKILELLHLGNSRRKTESTDANATSSRSHAVLEIIVKRKQRNQYRPQVLRGKLALVDLAGSERASETNNAGQKLRDGANINRSLLALANCINALGKQQKKGLAYVPYRNSKLTRILKDGLSGNSRTIMLATVSSGDDQYHYTINTLKYADRAKEIKTHIQKNIGTLDSHVADYQQMIGNLQVEVCQLKKELAEKQIQLSGRSTDKTQDNEMSWLDLLSRDINENVEERINLQKALFELEDINLQNRIELQQLDELIARHKAIEEDGKVVEALVERRQVILDNVRDNDEAGGQYQEEIEQNEAQRKELQHTIDEAMRSNGNMTYLRILSQYRLLGMTNTELQFQIAIRDHIISNQREILSNLWTLLEGSDLDHKQILELAARQGITIENWIVPPAVTCRTPTVGSPLSCKENQGTTCGQCISLVHLPVSPDRPRTYEHLNWKICSSCRNTDCQNASPKCLHSQLEEFCSGGRERSNHRGHSQFPMMQLISPNHKLDKGYLLTSEFCENQALLPPRMCAVPTSQGLITRKLSCEMCLLGPKDNCVCPLVPKAASPPAIAGIRADSHGKLRRQTWPEKQHCCSNNERNICTTCSFDANERRGADGCCIGCARRRSCSSCEGFQHLEEYEHQKDFPPTNIHCQKLQGSHQESCGDYECDPKQSKVESMWERIGNGNKIYFSHNGGHHTSSSLAKSYIMYNSHNTEDEIHRFSDVPYRASKLSSIISVRSGCATHRCAGSAETLMEGQKTMAFESEWDLVSSPLQPRRLWPGDRADCM